MKIKLLIAFGLFTIVFFLLPSEESKYIKHAVKKRSLESLRQFSVTYPESEEKYRKRAIDKLQELQQWFDEQSYGELEVVGDATFYRTILMRDNRVWMADNLNYKGKETKESSWCANNDEENCKKYGRLYKWAIASRICPTGWHLPTDDEWWNLVKEYGGAKRVPFSGGEEREDPEDSKKAFWSLVKDGDTKFNATLGGRREIDVNLFSPNGIAYRGLGRSGRYWTATQIHNGDAYYYDFSTNRILRGVAPIEDLDYAHSCRCIRDR